MKGNNVLYFNEATMIEIVEGYLNAMLKDDRVTVTMVEQNQSQDNKGMFRVAICPDDFTQLKKEE